MKNKREYYEGIIYAADSVLSLTSRASENRFTREARRVRRAAVDALNNIDNIDDMYKSLRDSIDHAGGSTDIILDKVDKGMTVNELITGLGPNGVRFTVIPNVAK